MPGKLWTIRSSFSIKVHNTFLRRILEKYNNYYAIMEHSRALFLIYQPGKFDFLLCSHFYK